MLWGAQYCKTAKRWRRQRREMHKMSKECTSMQIEMIQRYINNPEDVYFNTFDAHFISLRVCVFYYCGTPTAKEKLHSTKPLQQLCALMVISNCAMLQCCLLPYRLHGTYITHRYCANTVLTCALKVWRCILSRATCATVIAQLVCQAVSVEWEHSVCSFIWIP